MPTPHPVSSFDFCFRRVVKFLGVSDPNYPEGTQVMATSPYTLDQIRKQICQSDVETCTLIASVEDNPYRNQFFTETPTTINAGARIPAYVGVHGGVEVFLNAAFVPGRLAQSFEHLQRVADKYAISALMVPAKSQRLYWIENGRLQLAVAATGRVYVPTIPIPDDTAGTPVLATPKALQWAPIAHAIMTLRPVGSDSGHRNDWGNIWAGYAQMILSGHNSLPEPERMQRIAA